MLLELIWIMGRWVLSLGLLLLFCVVCLLCVMGVFVVKIKGWFCDDFLLEVWVMFFLILIVLFVWCFCCCCCCGEIIIFLCFWFGVVSDVVEFFRFKLGLVVFCFCVFFVWLFLGILLVLWWWMLIYGWWWFLVMYLMLVVE